MKILDLYNIISELQNNPPHGLVINFEKVKGSVNFKIDQYKYKLSKLKDRKTVFYQKKVI